MLRKGNHRLFISFFLLFSGTIHYDLDQTSLTAEFFDVNGSSLYVKNSLTSFSLGQILTITGKATDGGGRQATATVYLVMAATTTTNIVTTTTERYYTFIEDPRNTAWLTAFCVVTLAIIGIMGYLIYSNFIKKRYVFSGLVRTLSETAISNCDFCDGLD